jgi:CysZ protein
MIFTDFSRALAQIGDQRFRRVVFLGVLLALALLVAVYALLLIVIQWFDPGSAELFMIGPVEGLGTLLSIGSFFLILGLSIVLMVPTAAAFSGIFVEDVADAVEDEFYPGLPPAPPRSFGTGLIEVVNFTGVFIAVNFVLLVALFLGPLYIPIYWAANGWLLGREYFNIVALRRLPPDEVKALRRQHGIQVWIAGTLMAAPLSIPLLNLVIPVLGVATFTHLFHRLAGPLPRAQGTGRI